MNKQNRRTFLQTSAAALATSFGAMRTVAKGAVIPSALPANLSTAQGSPSVAANEGKKPLRLGLIIGVGNNPDAAMAKVHDLGLPTCQVFVNEIEAELVSRLRQALDRYQIEATSLVVGGPGKEVWDFYQGPLTIGLVPRETRAARIAHIKKASDFAKQCGIPAVQTHCGFIPENGDGDARSGRLLQAQRPEFPLRNRPGNSHHLGASHSGCRSGQSGCELRRRQSDSLR